MVYGDTYVRGWRIANESPNMIMKKVMCRVLCSCLVWRGSHRTRVRTLENTVSCHYSRRSWSWCGRVKVILMERRSSHFLYSKCAPAEYCWGAANKQECVMCLQPALCCCILLTQNAELSLLIKAAPHKHVTVQSHRRVCFKARWAFLGIKNISKRQLQKRQIFAKKNIGKFLATLASNAAGL